MAQRFLTVSETGANVLTTPLASSAGTADAGKIIMTDEEGKLDPSLLPADSVETIRDVVASEAISANRFVNIYWDETAESWRVRNADATNIAMAAVGYVTDSVAASGTARVYLSGELQLSGIDNDVTELYLTDTPGVAGEFSLTTALADGWKLLQLVARRTGASTFAFVQSEAVRL
jgi:hypothetical protein